MEVDLIMIPMVLDLDVQQGHIGGDGQVSTKNTRSRAQPVTEKQHKIPIGDSLVIGNDPAIFDSRKPQTRQTSCHNCGLFGSRRCSRCHMTYYCSEDCQIQDWKSHSVVCKPTITKVTNGEKPLNKDGDSKAFSKPPDTPVPTPRNKEEDGGRVMLCDLKVETLSEGKELQCLDLGEWSKPIEVFQDLYHRQGMQDVDLLASKYNIKLDKFGCVSEFSSPSNFFVQEYDERSVETLMQLSVLLSKIYSSPENLRKDYVPEIWEICAAKYSQDQQWYRVLVCNVEISMKIAHVLYLDYGNQETLPLSELQPMRKDLGLTPPCAMNFRVAHARQPPCGWSPECLIDVKRLLMGQKLSFRVVHVDQKELPRYSVEVSLPESGTLLHKVMEEKGYSFVGRTKEDSAEEASTAAKPSQEPVEKQQQSCVDSGSPEPQGKLGSFRVGDRFEALVTVFHNPEMFFCQAVQNAKELAELVSAMNKRCSTLTMTPLSLPAPGKVCCAQFTADNNWYRASVVKHISDDTALVGYLDFGNTETLDISRLRPIDADMLIIPFQAAQCRLAGVKPPSGTWSSEVIHKVSLLLMNKVFTAVVVSESAGTLTLDLIAKSATQPVVVSQHLIAAGLAEADHSADVSTTSVPKEEELPREPPAQLPLGQEKEVMVCMLQSPEDFFCHIYNPTDLSSLNNINVSLGKYCAQHVSEGYTPIKGDVCGAFFSGDGNWYRGQVKDCTSGGAATVHFLDYGNTEEVPVDKLCKIPSTFLELPFQAIKCSLAGVKPLGDKWDPTAAEKFHSCVAGIKLRAKAVSRKLNGYLVQLAASESGEAIADVLLAEKVAVPDDDFKSDVSAMGPGPGLAARKAYEGGSPARSHVEHKLTKETIASPLYSSPAKEPTCSSHEESYSHSVQPINSTLPALQEIEAATNTPNESFSHLTPISTARANHSGNAALCLHRPVDTGYSTPSFQKDFTSSTKDVSSASPAVPAHRESASGNIEASRCRGLGSAASPLPSPSRLTFPRAACPRLENGPVSTKDSPPSPDKLKSTLVGYSRFTSACYPPRAGPPCNGSNRPAQRELPTADSTRRDLQPSECPAASQPAPSVCEDLPTPATSKQPSSVVLEARGVSMAQSWTSVDLPPNEPLAACVLRVRSPDLMYVFPKDNRVDVEALQQVMVDIFSHCNAEAEQPDYRPSVGDACCAKFTGDGQWYRAVVLEVSESAVEIGYADYGNLETLPFSGLRPVKESFLRTPMQITRCRLYDVAPATHQWSPEGTQSLSNLLLGADVALTARSLEDGIYAISIEKKHGEAVIDVGEKLVMDGLAKRPDAVPSTDVCKEKEGCCCQELRKRVEKLELLLEKMVR
ncbi:PREDICTED: tudor domain-containing protein 1 [Nanorana parkeri]|uniref:tudor domain-containing protein 1 n=1 Tax=Nanorana parkeri TaxID=125878 RepID=UPI00085478C8|nr:PREDICTED: tudor domain-containing protein 1 [Nanorana parkeri]